MVEFVKSVKNYRFFQDLLIDRVHPHQRYCWLVGKLKNKIKMIKQLSKETIILSYIKIT